MDTLRGPIGGGRVRAWPGNRVAGCEAEVGAHAGARTWAHGGRMGGGRIRVRGGRRRAALRVKWRVAGEDEAELADEIDEVGRGVDPILEVWDGYKAGGVDVRVGALDNHVAGRVDIDARRMARVGLHEPYDDGDVVGDALKGHRDGAIGLEEVDGAAIVMGEGGGLRRKRGV